MTAGASRLAWQCPRCTFVVLGNPTDPILAEIRHSHEKRHRRPQS